MIKIEPNKMNNFEINQTRKLTSSKNNKSLTYNRFNESNVLNKPI